VENRRRRRGWKRLLLVGAPGAAALLLFACSEATSPTAAGTRVSDIEPLDDSAPSKPHKDKDPASPPAPREKKEKDPDGASPKPSPAEASSPRPRRPSASVTRVVDGDTIEVTRPGGSEDVRLIGIDTPETVHPTVPVECFGPKASSFTNRSLLGRRVRLEFDEERRDHYGRLLAYVWLDGKLFNKVLVERGYAEVTIYEPNDAHEGALYAAESRARSTHRGAWGACRGGGGGGSDSPGPEAGSPGGGSKCDPNYKGGCIPVYPPDIDCDDVTASNFRSVGTDPHGFDADGDRVACEG
jgi:micrococcal nuclease